MHTPGEACPLAGGDGGFGRCAPEVPAQNVLYTSYLRIVAILLWDRLIARQDFLASYSLLLT